MQNSIDNIKTKALKNIKNSTDLQTLESVRINFLGKKGEITSLLKDLKDIPKEQRPKIGQLINQAKALITKEIEQQKEFLTNKEFDKKLSSDKIDITIDPRENHQGTLHPITKTIQKIENFFHKCGYISVDGPEIEDYYHNFDALNIAKNHPARNPSDTFYIDSNSLLRTQTSGVQIRHMKSNNPPLKIISPGRVYRNDYDQTHTPMFHQVEGLFIDENINFSHLKGVLTSFLHYFFGEKTKVRFRPSFFPFTEPSAEIDILGENGFLEILGAGMVHPNVLKEVNIDPKKYQGFAFGIGVERLAMLDYKISDIRILFENDKRLLSQFA